jgi:hypothetical protein
LTGEQHSDFKGAGILLKDLPKAETLIGDRWYDRSTIRNLLAEQAFAPCIPPKQNRKQTIDCGTGPIFCVATGKRYSRDVASL